MCQLKYEGLAQEIQEMKSKIKALEANISQKDAKLSETNSLLDFYKETSRTSPTLEVKLHEAMEKLGKQDSLIKTFKTKQDNYRVEYQEMVDNRTKMITEIKALQRKNEEMSKELLTKNSTLQCYAQNLRAIPQLQAKILEISKYVTDQKSIIQSLQAGIAQRDTWLAEKDCLLPAYAKKLPSVAASEAYHRAMQNASNVKNSVEVMEVDEDDRYVEFEDLSIKSIT
jgi:chromosome segregation ATPase